MLIKKQKWEKKTYMGYKAVTVERLRLLIFFFNKSVLLRIWTQVLYSWKWKLCSLTPQQKQNLQKQKEKEKGMESTQNIHKQNILREQEVAKQ